MNIAMINLVLNEPYDIKKKYIYKYFGFILNENAGRIVIMGIYKDSITIK